MKTALLLLLTVSAFAQVKTTPAKPVAPSKSAMDKATLEAYLRHMELWQPQVAVKIDDATPAKELPGFFNVRVHLSFNNFEKIETYYVSQDGKRVLKADVHDINQNPFQAAVDKLKFDGQPSLGPAHAPVTIAMFSDFECPVCKEEAGIIRENLLKTFPTQVKLYFMDFPLDSIHPWAHTAALAGRCVAKQNPAGFWDYFDWVYGEQQQITLDNFSSKFQAFANDKKLDGMQLGRCVDSKAGEPEVARTMALGRDLGVSATPTMFMNGRKLEGGLNWQTIEALVNIEAEHQTKAIESAKKADEECCTVQIPKIVK